MSEQDKIRAKKLRAEITALSAESSSLRSRANNLKKDADNKTSHMRELQKELESLNWNYGIKISEHAILRYLERVKGLDIEEVQKEILSPKVLKMIETLGETGTYPGVGYKVVVKEKTIVTVI